MEKMNSTYISLGSNQGDKFDNIQKAIDLIDAKIGNVVKIASLYKTPSLGFKGDDFFNTCVEVLTTCSSEKLIEGLLSIEKKLGRVRQNNLQYTNRTIDIDILLFEGEIINSENLIVPHPRMLDRKFVLYPLIEIAQNIIHPITKKQLKDHAVLCKDTSSIELISQKNKQPNTIAQKYNYIAIEGNIGAGKTSLANMISNDFNAKLVLERFEDNPFLPKFYQDSERYAFPLEMSFLADRYQQLSEDLAQFDLFKDLIVSDYYMFKSLIFAQVTLSPDEYSLYRRMFDLIYTKITKPDLYVYLYQNTDRLIENIKKRGRQYEQNISVKYLSKIHEGYKNFIQSESELNCLVIDITDMDFVADKNNYQLIIDKVKKY